MDSKLIILICVGSVIVLAALVLLYFTVFAHARLKRQARDLCGRFEQQHANLFGQDCQYVKRLETISSMNLLYVQQSMDWSKKYKDIRDVSDASAQAAVNQLKDYMDDRDYRSLKGYLPTGRKIIDDYETQVKDLTSALLSKFKDEDECRSLMMSEREKFRKLKTDYYSHQQEMSLVVGSFDRFFRNLNDAFNSAEQDIENARYLDAKAKLHDPIDKVITVMGGLMGDLPHICVLISSIIPDKLASLSSHYEEMETAGYPLHHILLKGDMADLDAELKNISAKVQGFELSGIAKELEGMQAQIDGYMDSFEKEKEARVVFESGCQAVYAKENTLENLFIGICNALPKIKSIYLIGPEDQSKIDQIQNTINKAGATKRSLDTYVHSATKQPYSILVDKMKTLEGQAQEADVEISDFQKYLVSLKTDSEAANNALSVYYSRAKQAEKAVRDIAIESVTAKFQPLLAQVYSDIDLLCAGLGSLPIDVKKANANLAKLRDDADKTLQDVEDTLTDMNSAEANILLANRHRRDSADLNGMLLQAENLFYQGSFKQANEVALSVSRTPKEGD
jgi:septation ring formation regulator EzrA